MKDSQNNRIVLFLRHYTAPCNREVCGTCGGRLSFSQRLCEAFPNEDDLVSSLKILNGNSISLMRDDRGCMPLVLESLSEGAQRSIFDYWRQIIQDDGELALGIYFWTRGGKNIPVGMVYEVLQCAEPLLICSPELRAGFRKLLQAEVELPPSLKAAVEEDMSMENAKMEARLERSNYLDGLARIHFAERIPLIMEDQSIKYREWQPAWSMCTNEDIEDLERQDIQKLIDLCESNRPHWWTAPLKKLYDKRHQLRLTATEKIRRLYVQKSPYEQLSLLIADKSIPIEHYPIELAQYITPEWLSSLTNEERQYITELLTHTRLRTWRKVCRICGLRPIVYYKKQLSFEQLIDIWKRNRGT